MQVQCIAMTFWTSEVTEAIHIDIAAMKIYWDKCNYQISKIVDLVRGDLSLQNRITLGMMFYVLLLRLVNYFEEHFSSSRFLY